MPSDSPEPEGEAVTVTRRPSWEVLAYIGLVGAVALFAVRRWWLLFHLAVIAVCFFGAWRPKATVSKQFAVTAITLFIAAIAVAVVVAHW